MTSKEQNIILLSIANEAIKNPDWADYAGYYSSREKGMRKEAFKHLEQFLATTEKWTVEQRIQFTRFLFSCQETASDIEYGLWLCPHPLNEKLIKPTLLHWCAIEKTDNNPFRWYGKYYNSKEHLFKALELNTADDLARQTLLSWWMYDIEFSVHHLPEYYIGNPSDDIQLAEKINHHISQLTQPQLRAYWNKELGATLELITNYIEWKEAKHSNFFEWGKEHKKQTGFGNATTYYYNK